MSKKEEKTERNLKEFLKRKESTLFYMFTFLIKFKKQTDKNLYKLIENLFSKLLSLTKLIVNTMSA